MASISSANSRVTASTGLNRRWVIPILAGLLGTLFLSGVYLGIVTLAQGWQHAIELFWEDKFLVAPIIAGFGTQIGLHTFLKASLHVMPRGGRAMLAQAAARPRRRWSLAVPITSRTFDKLAGAKMLTLIVKNVEGVAERTFTWNLQ